MNKRRKKKETISEKISLTEWKERFKEKDDKKTITKNQQERKNETDDEQEKNNRNIGNQIKEWYITEEDIMRGIKKLKKKEKAAGKDQIPNEAWIHGKENILKDMEIILNKIKKYNKIPKDWNTWLIAPIYKKGDKEQINNYRGISLLDTGYKIFADIIQGELDKEIEKKTF